MPFIKEAQKHQPGLTLWASPWSPPTWMKTNKHYAMAMPSPRQPGVENGLRPDQVGREGTDMFVQEERYLRAYASYFGRFVDEYRKQGIADRHGDAAERVQLRAGVPELLLDRRGPRAVHRAPRARDGEARRRRSSSGRWSARTRSSST